MRRLLQIPMLILGMLLIGALGLHLLTGMKLLDAFYHSVILLTTVGYAEPQPLTDSVKVFITIYLAGALGVFSFSAFQFGQILVSSNLRMYLERRRMDSQVSRMEGHFIICGYGRMGATLSDYLHSRGQAFAVIDENQDVYTERFQQNRWPFICGDASQIGRAHV